MGFRRRRPLMGAAMIGGTAYVAGKSAANNAQRESDEQARIAELEYQVQQQQQQQQAPPPPAAAPAPARGTDIASKLRALKQLLDQGLLTPDEFAAAQQKLLTA